MRTASTSSSPSTGRSDGPAPTTPSTARGVLRAIDYQTGTIRWSHDLSGGAGAAGVLTTASGLTFTGDSADDALALRSSDGTTLWHSGHRAASATRRSPTSSTAASTVLFGGGSVLYAFALPQ